MLRATVFLNGSSKDGKVIGIPDTLEGFVNQVRNAFENPELSVVYTAKGGSVRDTKLIR